MKKKPKCFNCKERPRVDKNILYCKLCLEKLEQGKLKVVPNGANLRWYRTIKEKQ